MSEMHQGAGAVTKEEHDKAVKRKGRPFTDEGIRRRSTEQKHAPDLSAEWFGMHIEEKP